MATQLCWNGLTPSPDAQHLAMPQFQRIAAQIQNTIVADRLPAHASVSSERVIAEQYSVSRMTARRALELLEIQGWIYSEDRRGRYVSPHRLSYDVTTMVSFLKDTENSGTELEIDVLSSAESMANSALAAKLGIEVSTPVYQYSRLFRSKGHAIFVETEFLVAARFPGFLDIDLHQSTTRIFASRYNTYPTRGDIVIKMRSVLDHEAQWLGLTAHQAAVELEQVICDSEGIPFCVGRQLWRGELAEFAIGQTPT